MLQTNRRVRRRTGLGNTSEINFKKREELGELIILVNEHQNEVAAAAAKLDIAKDKLLTAMQEMKLTETKEGTLVAYVERSTGRSSNTVDPEKFRKAVKDDAEFYGAITVSMTEAKKVLPEKALMRITTTVAGKPGAPQVKVATLKVSTKVKAK